jgi:hypothetical protein
MWECPNCHQHFYNTNQSHSCGVYSVEQFLAGKTEQSQALFHAFLVAYQSIGDYELHPVKTRVALLVKMRFASINKLGADYLDGHLVLVEAHPDEAAFYKIDNLNNRFFVHHFRLYQAVDISTEFKKYMALAYRVGLREHVK